MDERDARACLDRLHGFIDEIDELRVIVDAGEVRSRAGREHAREKLRALKERLGAEHKRMSTVRGRAALNEVERAYYAPAVHEAHSHLMVKTSSIPDERWSFDLYEARFDLEHAAGDLRFELKKPASRP